ncbi:MAG: sigma-70 family RNA polymerase sigma factor [Gracilimonas sp.]|uniref:RNA polymerase sigma factor n=1 Tax=Gracilimonas TaxID=649462 RepID=UPI001B13B92A|nr:sigma-70 family RNA polymerase sigma factor [Gracilimonas sp.]MBO6585933.1 sigma-70 family RNA polymerase sigma factor [Gracilimonas sp.]MBO6616930.1 sigma-70 family RNA polymerase sigma factor [Gracilimonas sp.]
MFNWFKKKSASSFTNEEWVEALSPPPEDAAISKLRAYLVRGLKASLYKYVDKNLGDFVEDIAQDSVLKILDKLDTFRGESKFTTWAMKIAVREGYTELRRKRYDDISLHDYVNPKGEKEHAVEIEEKEALPDQIAHESMAVEKVMKVMNEQLTEKQKTVLQYLIIDQIPLTVVADKMDTNRNAIYKLVHDARLKLKNSLELEGIDPEKLLEEM